MTILVLMAGSGDAFREAAYPYPKNLVEVSGLPVVQHIVQSLSPLFPLARRVLFMVPDEEIKRYHTNDVIRLLMPDAAVLPVTLPTSGAACTALLAVEGLEKDEPLLVVNGDQVVADVDLPGVVSEWQHSGLDGGIVVFEAVHPRWSFVRCDENGLVVEAAEKRPISNRATAGMYYFARANDFVQSAMAMIKKDAHVDGAFYICPVYNEMILHQARIGTRLIPRASYFSLANPQGVEEYEDFLHRRSAESSGSEAASAFRRGCPATGGGVSAKRNPAASVGCIGINNGNRIDVPVRKENLYGMLRGWFVGDFSPTLCKTDNVEVGVKRYYAGEYEGMHYHKIATEITVIVSGAVEMNGVRYEENDILVIEPYDATDFLALTDVVTTVVKIPGASDDKYLGRPEYALEAKAAKEKEVAYA